MENPKLDLDEYKRITDEKIARLKSENRKLGKSLAVFFNIVEISGYVNSFISKDNLMVLINDMIIGVLGATKSTIYIVQDNKFIISATNDEENNRDKLSKYEKYMNNGQPCVINTRNGESINNTAYSILGMPICIENKTIGYIVAEHSLYNFFNDEHKLFLGSITNQIAIAIENARLYKEIQRAAEIDPLLSIYNRRTFFSMVEKELKNKAKDFAIIMMDLDNFKVINDTFGHQFGDEVLMETTNIIKKYLDKDDIIGRYGGEEIIIFMKNIENKDYIYQRVDNIRKFIEYNTLKIEGKTISITASFGISFSSEEISTLANNIHVADKLLYKAKYSGKNRVISSSVF